MAYDNHVDTALDAFGKTTSLWNMVKETKRREQDYERQKKDEAVARERNDTLWDQRQDDRATSLERNADQYRKQGIEWGQGQQERAMKLEDYSEDRVRDQQWEDQVRDRQEQEWGYTDEVRDEDKLDRATNRKRAAAEDEHLANMRPLQMQQQQLSNSALAADGRSRKAEAAMREQAAKAQQSSAILQQAVALNGAGQVDQAVELYGQLQKAGHNIPELARSGNADEVTEIVGGIIDGTVPGDSPQAIKVFNQMFRPSLVMSGRDPEKFEVGALRPLPKEQWVDGEPTYGVMLKNKQTGEMVPATAGKTSDDDDPITKIPESMLMEGAQNHIAVARQIETGFLQASVATQLRALQGRLSVEATGQIPQLAQPMVGSGKAEPTRQEQMVDTFLESMEKSDPNGRDIALNLIETIGPSDMGELSRTIMEIKEYALDNGYTPVEATYQWLDDQKAMANMATLTEIYVNDYGIEKKDAAKIAERLQQGEIDASQAGAQIMKLVKRMEDRENRASARDGKEQAPQRPYGISSQAESKSSALPWSQ